MSTVAYRSSRHRICARHCLTAIRMASNTQRMSEDIAVSVTPMRVRVAEEIRVLLARRRMSASELARRSGMTQPYISRRLTGEIAFDVDDLERIAFALEVAPADLLSGAAGEMRTTLRYRVKRDKRQVKPRAHTRPASRQPTRPPSYPQTARRPELVGARHPYV